MEYKFNDGKIAKVRDIRYGDILDMQTKIDANDNSTALKAMLELANKCCSIDGVDSVDAYIRNLSISEGNSFITELSAFITPAVSTKN